MNSLPLSDYDFSFPEELVASEPAEPRDSSRLMVVMRGGGHEHKCFADLPEYLKPGDCLVLNRTKVIFARLKGIKSTGGKAEMLLVRELPGGLWAALSSGLKAGMKINFPAENAAVVEGLTSEGEYICRFSRGDIPAYLREHGLAPLPPYIAKRRNGGLDSDKSRYQTVYAREDGSIAAPTAGLHFTPELLERLTQAGVRLAYVTLHVGRGTFRPITHSDAAEHRMLAESYLFEPEESQRALACLREGRRLVAVGTTATRTLETLARKDGGLGPGQGETDLYIRPGHEFLAVKGLLTNFHLPKSTPLLLASAFLGRERLLAAYEEAFRQRYRLFSYGDAMLIL